MPDIRGYVQSCVIIPDYSHLLDLERKRQDLVFCRETCEDEDMALEFLASKSYTDAQEFEKQLNTQEHGIDKALTERLKPSHTAFIALDSYETVKKLRKKLR